MHTIHTYIDINLMKSISDIAVIIEHFDRVVVQSKYEQEPYYGFNFRYLFFTSASLICASHLVTFLYWTVRRACDPEVIEISLNTTLTNQVQIFGKASSKTKRFFLWILPCIPTTLPTMLFCRISELTVLLEGNYPLRQDVWEEMVLERSLLMDISNDIKIIGKIFIKNC